jgi:hypothetical protein
VYNFKTATHKNKFHKISQQGDEDNIANKGGPLNPFFNVARNDILEGLNVFCILVFICTRLFFCDNNYFTTIMSATCAFCREGYFHFGVYLLSRGGFYDYARINI